MLVPVSRSGLWVDCQQEPGNSPITEFALAAMGFAKIWNQIMYFTHARTHTNCVINKEFNVLQVCCVTQRWIREKERPRPLHSPILGKWTTSGGHLVYNGGRWTPINFVLSCSSEKPLENRKPPNRHRNRTTMEICLSTAECWAPECETMVDRLALRKRMLSRSGDCLPHGFVVMRCSWTSWMIST